MFTDQIFTLSTCMSCKEDDLGPLADVNTFVCHTGSKANDNKLEPFLVNVYAWALNAFMQIEIYYSDYGFMK